MCEYLSQCRVRRVNEVPDKSSLECQSGNCAREGYKELQRMQEVKI